MSRKLIEGEDYYIENGKYVFTSNFHTKRGTCCGNRCKHCPYSPKFVKGTKTLNNYECNR